LTANTMKSTDGSRSGSVSARRRSSVTSASARVRITRWRSASVIAESRLALTPYDLGERQAAVAGALAKPTAEHRRHGNDDHDPLTVEVSGLDVPGRYTRAGQAAYLLTLRSGRRRGSDAR